MNLFRCFLFTRTAKNQVLALGEVPDSNFHATFLYVEGGNAQSKEHSAATLAKLADLCLLTNRKFGFSTCVQLIATIVVDKSRVLRMIHERTSKHSTIRITERYSR